jgi:phosphoadenosine phosphosulfate reductase
MWELIAKKGLPYRHKRFCCTKLKESQGTGAILVGVRAEESRTRKNYCVFRIDKKNKNRWLVSPILDWQTGEIWEYIKQNKLAYPSVYDNGFHRVGCMLCPFSPVADKKQVLAIYPKIEKAYYAAYLKYCEYKPLDYGTPEEVFNRWLWKKDKSCTPAEQGLLV